MVMKKLLKKFVDISNQNMEAKILDLELKMEHAIRDIDEIKELVRTLCFNVEHLQNQINDLIDSK